MTKKEIERDIIEKFIRESGINIEILSLDDSINEFSDYTGENPDFVVRHNNKLIGIDLFELTSFHFVPIVLSTKEKELNILNLRHLQSKREESRNGLLYENEELGKVAVEGINSKRDKIALYVTPRVWLIGYAVENFNFSLIKSAVEDGVLDNIRNHINLNINISERVERIFLFSSSGSEIIFEVK